MHEKPRFSVAGRRPAQALVFSICGRQLLSDPGDPYFLVLTASGNPLPLRNWLLANRVP